MHPSRTVMSTNSAASYYTVPLAQANSCDAASGFRTVTHPVPMHYGPTGHANQSCLPAPNRNNLHPQHHLYQNFNPVIPQYANRFPSARKDRMMCGSGMPLNNQQRQQAAHQSQSVPWSQPANSHSSRLPHPNHMHLQTGVTRPGEEHPHGVCFAQSAYHQAIKYSVPTQAVTSADETGMKNDPVVNSNRLDMRVVSPNGPPVAHPCKRNPPPPPPPRSGSWLVGAVTSAPDTHRDRDVVHPLEPVHTRHMPVQPQLAHGLPVSTPIHGHQHSATANIRHTRPASDTPNLTEQLPQRQWYSVDYAACANPAGNGHRISAGASSLHNPSDRCSPNPAPCCVNLPRSDYVPASFSTSVSSPHVQPRFVHRAPPPIPATNGAAGHSDLPVSQASTVTVAPVAPRSTVTDALLRLLVHHYASPESSGMSPSSRENRATLERLLQALCSNASVVRAPEPHDNGHVTLARRLLPQLIRIAYTELVSNEDAPGDGVRGPRPVQSHDVGDDKACGYHDQTSPSAYANQSGTSVMEVSMTASMESRQSCPDEDEDVEVDAETEESAYLGGSRDVFDSAVAVRADLDALPPGTSLAELKSAALEAILRLVPVYQTDASLCERDLGIVRLLATIHAYSTTQTGRIERLRAMHTLLSAQVHAGTMNTVPIESAPRCPVAEVAALVRLSFHPEHRTAICDLGGVHALIALLRCEQTLWSDPTLESLRRTSSTTDSSDSPRALPPSCTSGSGTGPGGEHLLETSLALRRYICMALTNLTYGVAANKALLCRRLANLEALLAQMELGNEELKQVSASVLRNLSWRTDARSKVSLRRVNAPRRLTVAAMTAQRDSTLRTTLSALWNLSAHCSHNKRAVCSVDGVFAFLLRTMHCDDLNNRLVIVENSGGILRNISAVVAGREDYRMLLNKSNCYPILVELLRHSPSLTVVVNICGTLWNLTAPATCPAEDLVALCRLGVIDLLHMLSRSTHELIRNSSTAVLRNLLHPNQLPTSSTVPVSGSVRSCAASSSGQQQQQNANSTMLTSDSVDDANAETQSTTETDVDLSSPAAELLYRRRVSARSRLPFGLLSVVLEADDDEEEEEAATEYESDTEGCNEDEDTAELEASIYAHGDYENAHHGSQEELVMVDDASSSLLHSNPLVPSASADPKQSQEGQQALDSDCRVIQTSSRSYFDWGNIDQGSEDEQARVYAEEGTPFPPDSATASCLELNNADHRPPCTVPSRSNPTSNTFIQRSSGADKQGLPVLTSYNSSDMLPQVYALEDSPLHIPSASSPCGSTHSDSNQVENSNHPDDDDNNNRHDGTEKPPVDDGPCLPSPPPDMSNLVSPLMNLNLDDEYEVNTTSGFNLPPPPPGVNETQQTCLYDTQLPPAESDFVQTPLVFSRGTSSYLSSGPLGTSPGGLQSSPQSECSDPVVDSNLGVTDNELETSAGSKCIVSPVDSVADDLSSLRFYPKAEGMLDDQADDEVRLPFAEEGTPQDAVSFVEDSTVNPYLGAGGPGPETAVHYSTFDWHNNTARGCPGSAIVADDDDDDEPGQARILQQCIASAMPGNSSYTILSATTGSTSLAADIARTVAFVGAEDGDNDSIRNFAVEDTPFGTSTKASSLSDLIVSEQKSSTGEPFADSSSSSDSNQHLGPMIDSREPTDHAVSSANHSVDRVSSSSSINGETSSDLLLSEVIQSAMPKSVPTSCDLAPTTTTTTAAMAATHGDGDCLQLYAMEGTPGEDEDLSGSSSVRDVCDSVMNSFTSHSSHDIGTATSSAQVSASTASLEVTAPGATVSIAPTPPRRTTSVLSNQRDPFAPGAPTTNRPQAMVAPMPQVARCQPTHTRDANTNHCTPDGDFSDLEKTTQVVSRDLVGAAILNGVPDKDDASSFSSLLSIESVGLEHSLLQECISSAMPRPKVGHGLLLRKLAPPSSNPQQWGQLRSDLCADESLREQTDEIPRTQSPEQPVSGSEPPTASASKSSESGHAGSAPSTRLTSIQASSVDSVSCSSPDRKPQTGSRSAPRKPADTVKRGKSGSGPMHFLDYGSDGALPRPPRSSCIPPATKSLTPARTQSALVVGASHQSAKPSIVSSASSDTKMSTENKGTTKPGRIVQPTTRVGSSLPVLSGGGGGGGGSRIPSSSTWTSRPAAVSGLPRATRVPAIGQPRSTARITDTLATTADSPSLVKSDPVSDVTDLLVEGAETVLAELCAVGASDESESPAGGSVIGSQSNHSLNADADGLLLNCLPNSTCGLSSNESLSLDLPASEVHLRCDQSVASVSPVKLRSGVQPSKLIAPSQIRSPVTTGNQGEQSLLSANPNGRTQGPSRLATPSTIPAQKPRTASSQNQSRVGRQNVASYAASRTTRSVQPKTTPGPSGLRAPSTVSHSRSALTCPPSTSSRSLASSRSTSTTGSANNLASVNQRSHAVSALSVCAALNKRDRTVGITKPMIRPQPGQTRSSVPSSLPYSIVTASCTALTTPNTPRSHAAVSGTASPNPDAPKPIRGGRKSLTGRKPDSSLAYNTAHQQPVQVKPVCKPKSVPQIASTASSNTVVGQAGVAQSSPRLANQVGGAASKVLGSGNRTRLTNGTDAHNRSDHATCPGDMDATLASPSGMWIVRGELGLVNGLQ